MCMLNQLRYVCSIISHFQMPDGMDESRALKDNGTTRLREEVS
jgi:hypothetical protein